MRRRSPVISALGDARGPAWLIAALLLAAAPAAAQDRPSARDAPLRGFTAAELARVEPLLAGGVVGLVDLADGDTIPAVHLAAEVAAPARAVAEILGRPEDYPRFMPALSAVEVRERHAGSTAFRWRWETSIFSLGGEAAVALLAPPAGQEARGYRVLLTRTAGDLGQGREIWRILPRGPSRSLVTVSTRMDLRDANYVTRQLSAAARSLSRSINLALAVAVLTRAGAEAERRVGHTRAPVPEGELARPALDIARLDPLLHRGDVLLLELDGAALRRASVATRVPHPESQVRAIMLDPVRFTEALITGSQATLRPRESAEEVAFDWRVDLPFVGTSGAMRLRERGDRVVELDAIDGAMRGGRWRFETHARPDGATAILGWARFDVADANFVLRAIVDADANFRPGLSAATEIMMARALRVRLQRM